MKRLLLLAIAGIFTCSAFAQIGIKAGVNLSSMTTDIEDMSSGMLVGFHAGVIVNMSLSEKIAVQPGVFYTVKGTEYDNYYLGKLTNTLNYIEIPVNIMYKFGGESFKIAPYLGPYIAYGISGKYKGVDYSEEYDIKFGSSEEDSFKPLDYGINFGIGAQMGKILFSVQYGLALANISTVPEYSEKLGVIGISAGYMFK